MAILLTEHAVIERKREDPRQRKKLFVALKPDQVSRPDVFQTKRITDRMFDPTQIARAHSDLIVQFDLLTLSVSIRRTDRPLSPLT